jgi:hypothetical protein
MSRGPGRIERAIRELFRTHPDLAFITDELAEHCYPEERPIERKHQVAVLRAAWNVIADDPDWDASCIEGMGGGYVFVNHANVTSYALGDIIRSRTIYRSEKRARRSWFRPATNRGQLLDLHAEWAASHAPHWAENVARHIAYRDADPASREALAAIWRAEAWNKLNEPDECYEAANVGGKETLTEITPPTDLSRIADRLRNLMTHNDPDALRASLAEIADTLDRMAAP